MTVPDASSKTSSVHARVEQDPAPPNGAVERAELGPAGARFDQWLRTRFTALNTELDETYYAAGALILTGDPRLEALKRELANEGSLLAAQVLAEPLPATEQDQYALLGAVGYFMGACRRHEIAEAMSSPSGLTAASRLAGVLGAGIGVAPRFVSAHQSSFNPAIGGLYRSFTNLDSEQTFLTLNGLGTLAYRRAAHAVRSIVPMGISNPMATYLLQDALQAVSDVLRFNQQLDRELDVRRFYLNVRPYYKTYRVGEIEYRGANAGDFAAINELDLLLGLGRRDDPFYLGVLADKQAYLPPDDQRQLQRTLAMRPLLDTALEELLTQPSPKLVENVELLLKVCDMFGAAYAFHHHRLVERFLSRPAGQDEYAAPDDLTASGPPLSAVVAHLGRIADLRAARDRPHRPTAATQLTRMRQLVAQANPSTR